MMRDTVFTELSASLFLSHSLFLYISFFAEAGQAAGFNVKLITVEVVSRGLIDTTEFSEL